MRRALGRLSKFTRAAVGLVATIGLPLSAAWAETIVMVGPQVVKIDPIELVTNHEATVSYNLFEGLTSYDPHGKLIPGQASHWTVSEDGRVYTFHLREGLKWSDGVPITADEFAHTLRRLAAARDSGGPQYHIQLIENAKAIAAGVMEADTLGVRALDDRTLEITLQEPASTFPYIAAITTYAPTPSHVYDTHGDDWDVQPIVVTNGPFFIAENHGGRYVLEPNPHFHTPVDNGVTRLIVEETGDPKEAVRRMQAGEIDLIGAMSEIYRPALDTMEGVSVREIPGNATAYVTFNLTTPGLSDLEVRRAMSNAIDVDELHRRLDSRQLEPARSFTVPTFLPPGVSFTPTPTTAMTPAEVMASKGYNADKPLKLRGLSILYKWHERTAAALETSWRGISVHVELESVPVHEFLESLFAGDHDVYLLSWHTDYPHALGFLMLPASQYFKDALGWRNEEYDQLVEQAFTSRRPNEEDAEIYTRLEAILAEERPILPLSHHRTVTAVSDRIKDMPTHLVNIFARYLVLNE